MVPQRALYTLAELARMAGISRWRMRRLLLSSGVEIHRSGRILVVYLSSIHQLAPKLWESLLAKERARERVGR